MDTIARAKGGCAGGCGALLTISQLLSQPGLQWLLWQWRRVGDFVFQDAFPLLLGLAAKHGHWLGQDPTFRVRGPVATVIALRLPV